MASPSTEKPHSQEKGAHTSLGEKATKPPARPKPENDAGIVPPVKSPAADEDNIPPENIDVFTLQPVSALKLLCRSIDLLVQTTGDVPPTPPITSPVRASIHDRKQPITTLAPRKDSMNQDLAVSNSGHRFSHDQIDGVPFKNTPIGSPEAHFYEPNSLLEQDVGYNAPPMHVQYGALARKFYSKRPPPISTEEYLLRMHKYCPMSTAVYLATAHYITRLAVVDRILPVTPRNVHRLLLAGLRVAMKALEDLSWPHSRFAKVGGVNEAELGRLEITFCFLMDFGLKVDAETLQQEAESLCHLSASDDSEESAVVGVVGADLARRLELKIPEGRIRGGTTAPTTSTNSGIPTPSRTPEKRKASSVLPNRPAFDVGSSNGIEVVGQS